MVVCMGDWCYRKAGANFPTKRLVPAHVVPSKTTVADVNSTPADKTQPPPAASADTIASAAVSAVVATQTYMKVCFCFDSFKC